MINLNEEKSFLNSRVSDYKDLSPYSEIKKNIIIGKILTFIDDTKGKVLQLGCSNGYETTKLSHFFETFEVADGSDLFIEKVKSDMVLNENIQFHCVMFEELNSHFPDNSFDYVICNYVLEHVIDVDLILLNILNILKPGGKAFFVVPNSEALSRKIAKNMGIIEKLDDLTENDHKHGHRRTYNLLSFRSDLEKNHFKILHNSGIVLKILADFQLNHLLNTNFLTFDHIIALQGLADVEENINNCDSIFAVVAKDRF